MSQNKIDKSYVAKVISSKGHDVDNVKLINADLSGIDLSDAKLINADLTNANLTNADLTNANLTNANLTNANLNGVNLTNANLSNANLTNANLNNVNLTETVLTNVQINIEKIMSSKFIKTVLTNTTFIGVKFIDVKLTDTLLKNTTFKNVTFENCDINYNFKNAKLDEVVFEPSPENKMEIKDNDRIINTNEPSSENKMEIKDNNRIINTNEPSSENKIKYNDRIINTNDNVIYLKPVVQQNTLKPKPTGLWYGFGTQWIDLCKRNPDLPLKQNTFKINISNNCNILKITNNDDLTTFEKNFQKQIIGGQIFIDWVKVAKKYDGIEIYDPNNNYELLKNDNIWSKSWDVGSGCIWNKCNVTFEKIEIDGKRKSKKRSFSKRKSKKKKSKRIF